MHRSRPIMQDNTRRCGFVWCILVYFESQGGNLRLRVESRMSMLWFVGIFSAVYGTQDQWKQRSSNRTSGFWFKRSEWAGVAESAAVMCSARQHFDGFVLGEGSVSLVAEILVRVWSLHRCPHIQQIEVMSCPIPSPWSRLALTFRQMQQVLVFQLEKKDRFTACWIS